MRVCFVRFMRRNWNLNLIASPIAQPVNAYTHMYVSVFVCVYIAQAPKIKLKHTAQRAPHSRNVFVHKIEWVFR